MISARKTIILSLCQSVLLLFCQENTYGSDALYSHQNSHYLNADFKYTENRVLVSDEDDTKNKENGDKQEQWHRLLNTNGAPPPPPRETSVPSSSTREKTTPTQLNTHLRFEVETLLKMEPILGAKEVQSNLERLGEKHEMSSIPMEALGLFHQSKQHTEQAIQCFKEALKRTPYSHLSALYKTQLLYKSGKSKQALQSFTDSLPQLQARFENSWRELLEQICPPNIRSFECKKAHLSFTTALERP
jgi:tetratricopeptide (TPR) repeat protein